MATNTQVCYRRTNAVAPKLSRVKMPNSEICFTGLQSHATRVPVAGVRAKRPSGIEDNNTRIDGEGRCSWFTRARIRDSVAC